MVPALLARAEEAEAGRAAAEQALSKANEMVAISRAERRDLEERLRRTESLLAGGGGSDSGLPTRTTPHPPPHPQSLPLRKVNS